MTATETEWVKDVPKEPGTYCWRYRPTSRPRCVELDVDGTWHYDEEPYTPVKVKGGEFAQACDEEGYYYI